jgi:alpha-L-fucosidase
MIRVLALFAVLAASATAQNFKDLRPSPQQLAWQDLEIGVLVHFGTNTFLDREWGDGTAAPATFAPTALDAEQWVTAAKAGGARYLVMVAKHHDGFALFPSRHTDYNVKASPYKDGKGDVVAEVAAACRKHGLAFGIYLSPWDRHDKRYPDSKAYDKYYNDQLTELASHYGPLVEFWLDGAGSEGHVYDFQRYVRTMRTYQPNVLLFADAGLLTYGDIRWVGNESGVANEENWNVLDNYGLLRWRPAEADTPLRHGHWFWHPNAENKLKSLDELMETYSKTVGRGAQLVLGLAPDNRGLMPEVDVKRLQEFGAEVQRIYGTDLTKGRATGTYANLAPNTQIDRVVLSEDLNEGQNVRAYSLKVRVGNEWKEVSRGTTIGHKKIDIFPAVTTDAVRLDVLSSLNEPKLKRLTVHYGGR